MSSSLYYFIFNSKGEQVAYGMSNYAIGNFLMSIDEIHLITLVDKPQFRDLYDSITGEVVYDEYVYFSKQVNLIDVIDQFEKVDYEDTKFDLFKKEVKLQYDLDKESIMQFELIS